MHNTLVPATHIRKRGQMRGIIYQVCYFNQEFSFVPTSLHNHVLSLSNFSLPTTLALAPHYFPSIPLSAVSEQGFVGLIRAIRAGNSTTNTIGQEAQEGQRTSGTEKNQDGQLMCKLDLLLQKASVTILHIQLHQNKLIF